MTTPHEKVEVALKRIRKIYDLLKTGHGRPVEKEEALAVAHEVSNLFTDEILKRKAEKLKNPSSPFKNYIALGGFLPPEAANQIYPWISLLEEYLESRKIKAQLDNERINIQSIVDGEDQHLIITEKESNEHAHLIIDGGTGEIRIDPKDKPPHDLIVSIEAILELKTGEIVQITKTALKFIENNKEK